MPIRAARTEPQIVRKHEKDGRYLLFAAALVTVGVCYFVPFQNKAEQGEKMPQQIQSETEEMTALEITESMAPPGTYEYVVLVKEDVLVVYRKGERDLL